MSSKKLIAIFLFFTMLAPSYGAMSFDGSDDYVAVGNPIIGASFTISMWVNITTLVTNGTFIAAYDPNIGQGWQWSIDNDVNTIMEFYDGAGFHDSPSGTLKAGEWDHIAITFSGGTVTQYFNGNVVDSEGGNTPVTTSAVRIADIVYVNPGFNLNGKIDDVRIYSRALPASEIQSMVNCRCRPSGTDELLAYWRLDEGFDGQGAGGPTVIDYSGRGYTGTPTSGPIWKGSILSYP